MAKKTKGGFAYGKPKIPTAQEYIDTVQRRIGEIAETKWCTKTIERLGEVLEKKAASIRCLAIGSPSDSQNAQFQLAFLVLLAKRLEIATVTVWDPLFERFDKEVFEKWGIKIEKEVGHSGDTLYYVPHGPRSLNVSLASHCQLIYLGNDFKDFIPHSEIDPGDKAALQHLGEHHIQSFPISRHERCFLAMNNLALHMIDGEEAQSSCELDA